MHSHAKTNEDNHLICVMYDLLSLDKLSDDLECLTTRVTSEATCWFCSKESLHCVGKKKIDCGVMQQFLTPILVVFQTCGECESQNKSSFSPLCIGDGHKIHLMLCPALLFPLLSSPSHCILALNACV